MSGGNVNPVETTRARLEGSRAALLAALEGVTEADFRREVDGRPLVELLAALARAERDAVSEAQRLRDGEVTAPAQPSAERGATLPPQAIHALAGARHRAALLLNELASEAWLEAPEARQKALAMLDAAAEREQRAAERVAGRHSAGASGG